VTDLTPTQPQQIVTTTTGVWSPIGWAAPEEMTFDDWLNVGMALSEMTKAIHWWVGDWVNAGEARWGERYAQALGATEFVYGTLANDAWVTRRVPFSLRNENLSWTHHVVVAALDTLDERREWLEMAAANDWSTRTLREKIREWQEPELPEPVIELAPAPSIVAEYIEALIEKEELEPLPDDGPRVVTVDLDTGEVLPAAPFSRNGYEPQRWAAVWKATAQKYRRFARSWQTRAERLEKDLAELRRKHDDSTSTDHALD